MNVRTIMIPLVIIFLCVGLALGYSRWQGDPMAGRQLADNNCGECHDFTPEKKNKKGPTFWGLYNRPAGSVPDFRYSDHFRSIVKEHPFVWDEAHLQAVMSDPSEVIPGTRMAAQMDHTRLFEGIQNANRRDMMVFLKSLQDPGK